MHFLQKQKEKINGKRVLFHGRMEGGLKQISPHKSKHEKAYVYASENKALCVIFSLKRKGEDIYFRNNFWGKTEIYEMYDGAFEERFKGRKTHLYRVLKDDFKMETSYIEWVSDKPVNVILCEEITDAYDFMLDLQKHGKVKIFWYKNYNKKQRNWADEKLKKALKKYINFKELTDREIEKLTEKEKESYIINFERKKYCYNKFPEIMKKLENENKNPIM